ncbi:Xyloglucan endotransglucosylase/hydrolase [Thalictrum thalictroides]|uniref:Xyloglucan endotransglucosylase/hydrolase n=1 Tax=Thalictrum thalictroides TaxID=46969 RepID=A0A7J6X0N1_THATH|nr:Xyloglucan endotransglucosylase/hydrolase [Thalictrum thalictroides]
MGKLYALFIVNIISLIALASGQCFVDEKISKNMYITWGAQHSYMSADGEELQFVLDKSSGSAVQSKYDYLFGTFEMQIKLVPGNSAGTVTAYYLSSTGVYHDEIDFEFLGNTTKNPYIIHTNLYTQGKGSREEQFYPWFDPSADFHNYTIQWEPSKIVWYIDGTPIRIFRNYENMRIPFPNKQGMKVYSSLWNADNWATRGGRDKIDWSCSPFKAGLRRFRARTYKWNGPSSTYQCGYQTPGDLLANVYNKLNYGQSKKNELSSSQLGQMKWIRDNKMIYSYCKDTMRFKGNMPPECSLQQYY